MSQPNGQGTANPIEQEFAALIGAAAVENTKLKAQLRMANAVIEQQAREIVRLNGDAKIDAAVGALVSEEADTANKRPRRARKLSA